MKEIAFAEFTENPFTLIEKDWMLITAQSNKKTNMMTASWGALGIIWGKPAATVYVRESRYTKEFLDAEQYFSLCVLPEDYRKQLAYCGSSSGRTEDKVLKTGLTVQSVKTEDGNTCPYFAESRLVLICKKVYSQNMKSECLTSGGKLVESQFYKDGDWHTTYIGHIEKILVQ